MTRFSAMAAALVFLAGAPEVFAQGTGGDPKDRLDWPGSPTDRYLSSDEVRDRMHESTDGFFQCFKTSLRSKPEGGSSVTFAIDGDGRAQRVQVDRGKAPEALAPCIESVVRGIEFGAHDGDDLDVSYPLVYEVDTRGARVLPYPIVFTRPRPIRLPLLSLPLDITAGELRMLELILTEDAAPAPSAEEDEAKGSESAPGSEATPSSESSEADTP